MCFCKGIGPMHLTLLCNDSRCTVFTPNVLDYPRYNFSIPKTVFANKHFSVFLQFSVNLAFRTRTCTFNISLKVKIRTKYSKYWQIGSHAICFFHETLSADRFGGTWSLELCGPVLVNPVRESTGKVSVHVETYCQSEWLHPVQSDDESSQHRMVRLERQQSEERSQLC
jgi:hypothetical protein